MRRRAVGVVAVAAAVACLVVALAVAPAGATATRSEDFRSTVSGEMESAGRCVTADVSGTLVWTVRRGPLVAGYSGVEARDVQVHTSLRPGCGEDRGALVAVGVEVVWPEASCGAGCAGPLVGEPPPDGVDGWGEVEVNHGFGTAGPAAPQRTWAGEPLCRPLLVRVHAQTEVRLTREERNAGYLAEDLELPVTLCVD